jgi:hypothetical protein
VRARLPAHTHNAPCSSIPALCRPLPAGALLASALPLAALGAAAGAAAGAFASTKATDEFESRAHFFALVSAALGAAQYVSLAQESLLQMRLAAFVRRSAGTLDAPARGVRDVRTWSSGAGPAAGVGVATKGALGVSLRVDGTRLAFVCCHLVRALKHGCARVWLR